MAAKAYMARADASKMKINATLGEKEPIILAFGTGTSACIENMVR